MAVLALVLALVAGCSARARFERARLPLEMAPASPEISDQYLLEIDSERVRLTKAYLLLHNPGFLAQLPEGDDPGSITFEPRVIVVHYTVLPTLEETLDSFRQLEIGGQREVIRSNGHLNVGIQFVVDRDGLIYHFYPETTVARHVIGLNHVAIGIENIGDGDLGARRSRLPLTPAQLEANIALVRYLAARYPTIRFLIGHQEYRDLERAAHPAHHLFYEEVPTYRTEKDDPGRRFLKRLRKSLRTEE